MSDFVRLPYHTVRGHLVTASATLTTGTAGSLIAGDSDYFLDLLDVTATSNTTVTTNVILKSDGTTLKTLQLGAGTTSHIQFENPIEQPTKAIAWQADMEDVTGTSVTIEARFQKRVPKYDV